MALTTTDATRADLPTRLAGPLTIGFFTLLAVMQAVVFAVTGAPAARAVGVSVLAISVACALAPARADRWRLPLVMLAGVAGAANFACYLFTTPEPYPLHVLHVLVGYGYGAGVAVALGTALLRRPRAALVVAAAAVAASLAAVDLWVEEYTSAPVLAGGVRWVGGTAPHRVLGEYYVPGSVARTIYPNNPRGYFTVSDPRLRMWELQSHDEGSAATLELLQQPRGAVRVAISRAEKPVEWHIQLNLPGLHLSKGRRYVVAFRIRADAPRKVSYGVAQAHEPWKGLGWYRTVDLGRAWSERVEVFVPDASDDNARLHFDLGGSTAGVELSQFELKQVDTGESIVPQPPIEYSVTYRFNDRGCRGDALPVPAPAGRRRVLALGDSFTLGVGVHEQDTFPVRLQGLLNDAARAHGSPVTYDVANCGVSGYSTREERLMFEIQAPYYKPDLVVLAMVFNDDMSWRDEVTHRYFHRPDKYERLFMIWNAVQRARYEARRPKPDFTNSLREMHLLRDEVAKTHAHLAVMIFRTSPVEQGWTEFMATVPAGLKALGVPAFDLGPLTERRAPELMVDPAVDGHPNEIAHRLAAERLQAFLREQGWVE